MAGIGASYQAKVGREQGGDRFYMKEDGEFKFFDEDFTGKVLRGIARSRTTFNTWDVASMGGTSLAGVELTLTPAYGVVQIIDMAVNESGYLSLASAEAGDDLIFTTHNNTSNAEVTIGMSDTNTASLYNQSLVRCSALRFSMSTTNGSCFIHLRCFTDGIWSVLELNTKDNNVLAMPE